MKEHRSVASPTDTEGGEGGRTKRGAVAEDLFEDLRSQAASKVEEAVRLLESLSLDDRVAAINEIRAIVHRISPFADEPVDCVLWVRSDRVTANDYNPNAVAPPEMKLLQRSIEADGFTQPIVSWPHDDIYEVIDGFHRHRVGKESQEIRERVHGYLPLAVINTDRQDRSDRIAATIRHNRARGKHRVGAMSDIVIELKRRNWSNARISKELGMDEDEILRLCQITGLTELFSDQEFSRAWDVVGEITEDDYRELVEEGEDGEVRTANTNDPDRIFHRYQDWECYPAGFYATGISGISKQEGEEEYRRFLTDDQRFRTALEGVITHWKHSCEHYLTNVAMNRIAWLGQAAACYGQELPAVYRGGFHLLSPEERDRADNTALEYLNKWLVANGREQVTIDTARSYERQSDIY